MTASTETGVEGLDDELEVAQLNGVTTAQPKPDTTPPPADEGSPDSTGSKNGSGPMQPHDGIPGPHEKKPPQNAPKPQH